MTVAAPDLLYAIDTPLDEIIERGQGGALLLEGWIFSRVADTARLTVCLGARRFPVVERTIARQDILVTFPSAHAAENIRALRSGFWVVLPLPAAAEETTFPLSLELRLKNGQTLRTPPRMVTVAASPVVPPLDLGTPLPAEPRVCICMATYNPPEDVFRRQIDSIRAQTHTNWICLIQDDWSNTPAQDAMRKVLAGDPRFIVTRNETNVGFFRNFERCLRRVPDDCQLVCLSDQDDAWYPDKLATLIAAFEPGVTLAYADMRIVDQDGRLIVDTFWTRRRNNYTDFETLFFANTVTGAASMFRASLLPWLLPFPAKRPEIYHDWWIALVALAAGRIAYVDRPLHDYYQHSANVIGWDYQPTIVSLRKFVANASYRREIAHMGREVYHHHCKSRATAIEMLHLRVSQPRPRGPMRRLLRLNRRPLITLAAQCLRARLFRRPSERHEKLYFMAYSLIRMLNVYFARKHQQLLSTFASPEDAASAECAAAVARVSLAVDGLERKCEPITLDVSDSAPPRVNMLLGTIDFKYFFGGYIGMFQLAKHLALAGCKMRFVILDRTDFQPQVWRHQIKDYTGLDDVFDLVEVSYHHDRQVKLEVSPHDRFIATSCWSAWIADSAARQLNVGPSVFMIQEYEPYFFAHGSYFAHFHASYDLDIYAVFSTDLLRDFFRTQRIGIYRDGLAAGDGRSIVFHNAILDFGITPQRLRRRTGEKRRFLFYCRPEAHAQRNLFELGILALRQALRDGALDPARWDFFGIGSVGEQFVIPLADGATMSALPKTSLKEYGAMLPDFDVGMSLMYTPHPSLVPLEMAAAGLVTVTNSYANKTAERLHAISPNFEVAPATIHDLAEALRRAAARVDDIDARAQGAAVNWPTSWDAALSDEVLRPLLAELARSIPPAQPQPAPVRPSHAVAG